MGKRRGERRERQTEEQRHLYNTAVTSDSCHLCTVLDEMKRRRWEEGGEVERKKRKAGEGIKASKKRVCINYNSVHEVYIYSLVEVNPKY